MNNVITANIVALVHGTLSCTSGVLKKKKSILTIDIIKLILATFCSLLLGAYAVTLCKPISLYMLFKGKKDKLKRSEFIILTSIIFTITIIVFIVTKNYKQLIAFVPMSIGIYRSCINEDDIKVKKIGIVSLLSYIPYNVLF